MRLAAWRGAGHGLVLAVLLIGSCSAPEAPVPERPALRFAHNLWPGYLPITAHRALYASATQTAQAIDGFLDENLDGLRVHALVTIYHRFTASRLHRLPQR